jgi:hypothetical protein
MMVELVINGDQLSHRQLQHVIESASSASIESRHSIVVNLGVASAYI